MVASFPHFPYYSWVLPLCRNDSASFKFTPAAFWNVEWHEFCQVCFLFALHNEQIRFRKWEVVESRERNFIENISLKRGKIQQANDAYMGQTVEGGAVKNCDDLHLKKIIHFGSDWVTSLRYITRRYQREIFVKGVPSILRQRPSVIRTGTPQLISSGIDGLRLATPSTFVWSN